MGAHRVGAGENLPSEHGIAYGNEFSQAVRDCLPKMPWTPEPSPERKDLTHLDICSVDPPGCTVGRGGCAARA